MDRSQGTDIEVRALSDARVNPLPRPSDGISLDNQLPTPHNPVQSGMLPNNIDSMPHDLIPFLAGVGSLILYLVWSAQTEMGTKWPWDK